MAVLEFDGYKIKEMSYQRNEKYNHTHDKIELNPELSRKIDIDEGQIQVTLTVSVGSLEDGKAPFQTTCAVVGQFNYHPEEDDSRTGLDQLVRVNAVAILYPYVRAIITMLTTASNEYPGYIMPTINVNKVLADQERE